jgi:hypothetical protein
MLIVALYYAPTMLAIERGHPNAIPIGIINATLGWTLIGWIVALAWAFKE